jgi:hypothetical protein
MTDTPGENWWKHLLSLWRQSGTVAGRQGLRLAIRNNYLNFYLRGQSVARVGFAHGRPYLETHVKYAFGKGETAQEYARVSDKTISCAKLGKGGIYYGLPTLLAWVAEADTHSGREKTLVDDLVADNGTVIDLEMGLPAWEGRKAASRMDCVALEPDNDGGPSARIVLWEAKMIGDERLRSRSRPQVADQFENYRRYLQQDRHRKRIEDAYRIVCDLFSEIHRMATRLGRVDPLNAAVSATADRRLNLSIDPTPRLLIFGEEGRRDAGGWDGHLSKLRRDHSIPCLVVDRRPFRFQRPS